MSEDLEEIFESEMWNIYKRAKYEAKYNATRYLKMLVENGGLETAHILINAAKVSQGYNALWELGRLDLTVEALIWDNPEYHRLFTEDELNIIKKRLIDYQYDRL
ncbi:MAG: hypothetical protein JW715_12725 [Sedimentisphaerales bacterium]|nr:hypothetical protein [Sedimentisphaerales bacterium]